MESSLITRRSESSDFDSFRARFDFSVCRHELSGIGDRFSARFEEVELGAVKVFRYEGQGIRGGLRRRSHILPRPADEFLVMIPLDGPIELLQHRHHGVIEPGWFAFLSTLNPSEGQCGLPPFHRFSELVIKIPGPLLRRVVPSVDRICAIPINARTDAARLMQRMVNGVLRGSRTFDQDQACQLGAALTHMIAAAARECPALSEAPAQAMKEKYSRVRTTATTFIEANLSDSNLNPATVAEHCQVSLRYLHKAFAEESLSVAAMIRELRLQRCHDELTNSDLAHRSIMQIATTWGFGSAASFTRACRRRFGAAPSELRGSGPEESR